MSLKDYIVSYIPGLWEDTKLSPEWLDWYNSLHYISNIVTCTDYQNFIHTYSKYLPYLSVKQLQEICCESLDNNLFCGVEFAAPPLLVNHSCHILSMDIRALKRNGKQLYTVSLSCSMTTRRYPKSYTDDQLHGESSIIFKPLFYDTALQYARKHWNHILTIQPHMQKKTYKFADPLNMTRHFPTNTNILFNLFVQYDKDYNDIVDDHSAKQYEVHNNHMQIITHSRLIFRELSSGVYTDTICCHHEKICCHHGILFTTESCAMCNGSNNQEKLQPICDKLYDYIKDHETSIRIHSKIGIGQQIIADSNLLQKTKNNSY